MHQSRIVLFFILLAQGFSLGFSGFSSADELKLLLRSRDFQNQTGKYKIVSRFENWQPNQTALILCDFWDQHHCLNAVRRMKEFGPRLNRVMKQLRKAGVTIIHAPSDCMEAYQEHPGRARILAIKNSPPPKDIRHWCSRIPSEESAEYPVDQSDGGEDDEPDEHRKWADELVRLGRNPNMPWKKQNDMIEIDSKLDFISDRGEEIWNLLVDRGVKNVILAGVHTNMCVLGRPFGLRQMKRNGINVVLMRDMTDTMYNPERWPYVSHHMGTDLVVSHIEKHVCPTMTSDQILGDQPFHLKSDKRPHVCFLIGEKEYLTNQTLPEFADHHLPDCRVTYVLANPEDRNDFPNLSLISQADILLVSVRRRVLNSDQMKLIRKFESSGKPILGIRTASHAFNLRNQKPPEGFVDWSSWDKDCFGGNYTNHYGNKLKSVVKFTDLSARHPLSEKIAFDRVNKLENDQSVLKKFAQGGSLYKTSPLNESALVLLEGTVLGHPAEPVAWTFRRANGGRSFYTSLGHIDDFKNPVFLQLLRSAIFWGLDLKASQRDPNGKRNRWKPIRQIGFPGNAAQTIKYRYDSKESLSGLHANLAFRCVARIGNKYKPRPVLVKIDSENAKLWLNGHSLPGKIVGNQTHFVLPAKHVEFDSANWLVLGIKFYRDQSEIRKHKATMESEDKAIQLENCWEWTPDENDQFKASSRIFLPAKFGGSTHAYIDFD